MKKIVATILLIALLVVPTTAHASQKAIVTIIPSLSFATTAAVSTVEINANTANDEISAVIKLYQGNSCIATWNASDVGYLTFRSVKVVDKGYTYTLTVDATIAGRTYDTVSTSAYFD